MPGLVAVADEDAACTNWAVGEPELHTALVLQDKAGHCRTFDPRFFDAFALAFGSMPSVYGYTRVLLFLTVFLMYELCIPILPYVDDSAIVGDADLIGFVLVYLSQAP